MPRKRFSAFEDFPADQSRPADWQPAAEEPQKAAEPEVRGLYIAGPTAASHVLTQPEAPQVERIERLTPSQMIPDRFQPRRLLPTALRQPFYSGQISCYQAAHQWLQMAKTDTGVQKQIDRLLNMGLSFEEHGQIKPITGSWIETPKGDYLFQIETGERRFWAACLQYAAHNLKEEPQLRVEVIAAPTRVRQVLENRHAEPPSAVGQACEVASLILAELGIQPETGETDEFDYFRKARAKRMPDGLWDKIMPVMNLTRPRLVQLLNILDLPTPLLDLADRYRLPERVLREVLNAPRGQWEALLRASIQNNLTSDDIADLTADLAERPKAKSKNENPSQSGPDPVQQAISAIKRFAHAMNQVDEDAQSAILDELANDLVLTDQAEPMITLLRDLSERLRIRQQNRHRRK